MASLYLKKGTNLTVNPVLGFSLLENNVGATQVTQSIVIRAEKQFLYYNTRFLNALNNGVISQSIYDTIIAQQGEERQVYEINDNLDISKTLLVDLVESNNIPNIETGGTSAQIIEDIITEGYVIVNKI